MKMKDVLKGMSTPKLIATLFESLRDRNVAESREFIKEATVELAKRPPIQGPKGDKGEPGVGAPLINNLNDGGTEAALTAEMGREIQNKIQTKAKKQVVDITEFGCIGDGIYDNTIGIQNAIDYAIKNKKVLYIPTCEKFFNIKTIYSDSNGKRSYSLLIDGSLKIKCDGKIGSSTLLSPNSLIKAKGVNVSIELDGIYTTGNDKRWDLFRLENDDITSSVVIRNCKTENQSIAIMSNVSEQILLENNFIGVNTKIEQTSDNNPWFTIVQQNTTQDKCNNIDILNNIIRQTYHGEPSGIRVSALGESLRIIGNKIYNISPENITNNVMDLDGSGKYIIVTDNIGYGGSYEYKFDNSGNTRDAIFSNNTSINSKDVGFIIRSSGIFSNLLVINPQHDAFFFNKYSDDLLKTTEHETICSNLIAYFDNDNPREGVRINNMHKLRIDGMTLSQLDKNKNMRRQAQGILINDANISDISFNNITIQGFSTSGIRLLPVSGDGVVKNLTFRNIIIEDINGFGICLNQNTFVHKIQNILFDNIECINVSGVPIEFGTSNSSKDRNIENVSFSNTHNDILKRIRQSCCNGLKMNGYGIDFISTTGTCPQNDYFWHIGNMVKNNSDGTIWLRVDYNRNNNDWVLIRGK